MIFHPVGSDLMMNADVEDQTQQKQTKTLFTLQPAALNEHRNASFRLMEKLIGI